MPEQSFIRVDQQNRQLAQEYDFTDIYRKRIKDEYETESVDKIC
ncbi:MAG: hypothetical protein WEA56_07095 [Balneolaceae bacterium]